MVEVLLVALNTYRHAPWPICIQLRGVVRANDEGVALCEGEVVLESSGLIDIFTGSDTKHRRVSCQSDMLQLPRRNGKNKVSEEGSGIRNTEQALTRGRV